MMLYFKQKIKFVLLKLKYLVKYKTFDFFDDIDIETCTACNRRCSYCPNETHERGLLKNKKLMDEKLFKKIINELALIKFSGRISPHFYGEPLLDLRIFDFVAFINKKLPKARISFVSNGDYLTIEVYEKLAKAGVTDFFVTEHGDKMIPNIKKLFDYLEDKPYKPKIFYDKFDENTPLYNRGGLVDPVVVDCKPRCSYFDNPLTIDYAGNVILCCNDYFSSTKFGNLKDKKLMSIWNSYHYRKIRKDLRNEKYDLEICQKCVGIIET